MICFFHGRTGRYVQFFVTCRDGKTQGGFFTTGRDGKRKNRRRDGRATYDGTALSTIRDGRCFDGQHDGKATFSWRGRDRTVVGTFRGEELVAWVPQCKLFIKTPVPEQPDNKKITELPSHLHL